MRRRILPASPSSRGVSISHFVDLEQMAKDIGMTASLLPCPNCHQPMAPQDLERHDHGEVRVDICFSCAGIWFDRLESTQLAPVAVIDLCRQIYAHRDDRRRPLIENMQCPRCRNALVRSFDLSKTGPFSYFRCGRDQGRFTPFFQFLREKQFVRSLTAIELQRIRSLVKQVNCSECGAPIDLEHDSQCKYCHAPIAFLDADAVEKAMHMWSEAENRRRAAPASAAIGDALMRMQLRQGDPVLLAGSQLNAGGQGLGLDLVALGIHAIGRLFQSST